MITIYRSRVINPLTKDRIEEYIDGAVVVGENGKISSVGDYEKVVAPLRKKKFKEVDRRGMLIMPGLIDCHLHLPQLDLRGKHGATLLQWLEKYIFSAERAFARADIAEELSKRFFKKLILNGTTTAGVYSTIHYRSTDIAFSVAKASGLRIILGKVMMDQNSPAGLLENGRDSLSESERLCEKWHNTEGGRLMYAFTPRFAPTCSESLLSEIGKMARDSGAYIQTHLAETLQEVLFVKKLFPDHPDYTSVYEENDCLTPKTLLGHAIHISDDEMSRIAKNGAKVIHCPSSNLFLKSGSIRLNEIDGHGITIGLGTDVGAGTSMSLFTTMRHADYIQPRFNVSPAFAFYLATLGGAKALSLEHITGNLAAGKSADLIVADIRGIDPRYDISAMDKEELLSVMMYRGNGDLVKEVYVEGKRLDVDDLKMKGEKKNARPRSSRAKASRGRKRSNKIRR